MLGILSNAEDIHLKGPLKVRKNTFHLSDDNVVIVLYLLDGE